MAIAMIIKGISIPIVDCSEKYPVHTYLFRIVPSFLSVVSPPPFFLQASIGSPTHIHRPSLGKGQKWTGRTMFLSEPRTSEANLPHTR